MKLKFVIAVFLLVACLAGCSNKTVNARTLRDIHFYSRTYHATPNECYYALRWALKISGYPLAHEDLAGGILTTTWEPVKADSHYIPVFDSPDYGVTGAYHQLEVKVIPQGTRTKIEVGSRIKSIAVRLKSSGVEERKVLAQVGNYLRSSEPSISNEGIAE